MSKIPNIFNFQVFFYINPSLSDDKNFIKSFDFLYDGMDIDSDEYKTFKENYTDTVFDLIKKETSANVNKSNFAKEYLFERIELTYINGSITVINDYMPNVNRYKVYGKKRYMKILEASNKYFDLFRKPLLEQTYFHQYFTCSCCGKEHPSIIRSYKETCIYCNDENRETLTSLKNYDKFKRMIKTLYRLELDNNIYNKGMISVLEMNCKINDKQELLYPDIDIDEHLDVGSNYMCGSDIEYWTETILKKNALEDDIWINTSFVCDEYTLYDENEIELLIDAFILRNNS